MKPVVATAAVLDREQPGCQRQSYSEFPEGTLGITHCVFLPSILAKLVELLNEVQNCRKRKSARSMEERQDGF